MANYIVKDGFIRIKLEDGRYWCPSLQARGTRYNISKIDLKKKKYNDYITTNFVAIDFETATQKERFPCQIGITVVRNGVIDESFSRLIQPHENTYSSQCIAIHHITPEQTKNEPLFPQVWDEVKQYFESEFLVFHNASFDVNVLCKVLDFYNLERPEILGYACTCDIFERDSLDVACKKYGIILNHHEAKSDSEACAQLYLCHINNTPQQRIIEEPKQTSLFEDSLFNRHETLKGDVLKKDLSIVSEEDKNNPFYDRKVVITGVFNQDRKQLGTLLKNKGADVNNSISKFTHFVLIGKEPGKSKIDQIEKLTKNGFQIRKLYQEDLDKILNGDYEGYYVDKEKKKDLNLTYDHFISHYLQFPNGVNPIYGKELYFGNNCSKNLSSFLQLTGNFGAFGNTTLDTDINICVLSKATIDSLKTGKKDSTIHNIEEYYNSNKAVVFDFTFVSEDDILCYCKNRIDNTNDLISLELYNKYINEE